MANEEQLAILKQGVVVWNKWRDENPHIIIDLSEANLSKAALSGVNLKEANLEYADLSEANLLEAILWYANLSHADLTMTYLRWADLTKANLTKATLWRTNLPEAILIGAELSEAILFGVNLHRVNLENAILVNTIIEHSIMIETNIEGADLTNCRVYGISVWDIKTNNETKHYNLIISKENDPLITVSNIEVAQFIYLLLNNQKIRHVIDTITTKVVLILGRFTPERKAILDSIREELRRNDYIPVLFDFDKPATRDTEETITTLAGLAKFIIADITDPKSIPQELTSIVKGLSSVPVQPIIQRGFKPWGMFDHIKRASWVLDIHEYNGWNDLSQSMKDKLLPCIEEKVKEIRKELKL